MVGEIMKDTSHNKELIFVYNANSGKLNAYLDTLHKIVSPKTYPCSLCDITYGYWGIKEEWAEFKKQMPLKMQFLHKDEWKSYGIKEKLPAVFLKEGSQIELFISAEEMNQFTLDDLKSCLVHKLNLTEEIKND